MGQFDGVTVNQLNGGLDRRTPTNDGTSLLVIENAPAATGLVVNTVQKLLALSNAEALGVTAAFDDANSILAHYHIDEFFRLSPNEALYIVLADNTFTDADLTAIIRANTDIKLVGIVRNDKTPIVDFSAYLGGYQNIADTLKAEHILIDSFLIEGNVYDAATAVGSYPDLRAESAPAVSVVISQDPVIRALKVAYEGFTSIGTALGALSVRRVNENLGSVDVENKPNYAKGQRTYPITNAGRNRFTGAVLQNGVDVNTLTATEKEALTAKGYIFAGSYVGLAGLYFSSSPTCTLASSDYAFIENNRIWNKAARGMRQALLPRVKSNVLKDPETGNIRATEAKELELIGQRPLTQMEADEEISGSKVYIDPAQQVDNNTPLKAKAQVVANGILHDIEIDLGLTNKVDA